MPFTVEVYDSKTGVCVDRIPNVVSIRTEGDFYFIYPSIEEPGNRHRTFPNTRDVQITHSKGTEDSMTIIWDEREDCRTVTHFPMHTIATYSGEEK